MKQLNDMVNTIFYFANSFDEYNDTLTNEGISDKTICFIKNTGEIYLDGKNYGKTPVEEIINDPGLQEVFDDSELRRKIVDEINTLRTDLENQIAGINTNIQQNVTNINQTINTLEERTVEAAAGPNINSIGTPSVSTTISADGKKTILTFDYLKGPQGEPLTFNDLTDDQKRQLKGEPGHTPTVEIRDGYWYIDGINTGVKARGEDGTTPTIPDVEPYDDTEIKQQIQDLIDELEELKNNPSTPGTSGPGGMTEEEKARIDELETNLLQLQDAVDALELSSGGMTSEEILTFVDNAIATSLNLLNLIKEHGLDNLATWSGWDDKLNLFIRGVVVGTETDEETGTQRDVTFSELIQKYNLLQTQVNAISLLIDENGEPISTETIQSMINQSIEDNTSITEIKNKYAFKNDAVMKWMGSGFESQVSPDTSFAQFYANGKQEINNNITSAVSGLRSEITTDEDGILTGALNSLVAKYSGNEITTMSGLTNKVTASMSESDMVASLNNNQSLAHSAVKATADSAAVDTLAEYGINSKTKISQLASDISSEITARTQLGNRVTSLEQKTDETSASIEGIVDASTSTVTASKIWSTLANDNSVKSAMKSEFATTIDGEDVASIVKEDIAQDFNQASWNAYVAYMKNGIAGITGLQQRVNANEATMESFAGYASDLNALKGDYSNVTALSIASKIANSTEAVNTLSSKFKPTDSEIATAVETKLNASATGGSWTSFAQQIANDHTTLGTLSTKVSTIEGKSFVETSMIAGVKDSNGNITGASIIAALNGDTSSVTINADKIDIGGVTILPNQVKDSSGNTLPNIITTAIAASTIKASQITSGKITASLIDSTNLNVNAANITGTIAASQIAVGDITIAAGKITGLDTVITDKIGAATISASKISGKLSTDNIPMSSLTIDASLVDFTGDVTATGLKVKAANIDGTITASQIKVGDITIGTNQITGLSTYVDGRITASSIAANSISITNSDYNYVLSADSSTGTLKGRNTSSGGTYFCFNPDGTGLIANGSISWDTNGIVRISNRLTTTHLVAQATLRIEDVIQDSGNEIVLGYDNGLSIYGYKKGTATLVNIPVTVDSIAKRGSSDSYVLLGGGGTKAISDFALTSSLLNYVQLVNGEIQFAAGDTYLTDGKLYMLNVTSNDTRYVDVIPNRIEFGAEGTTCQLSSQVDGLDLTFSGDSDGSQFGIYGSLYLSDIADFLEDVYIYGELHNSSDERRKNISIYNAEPSIEDVANAPAIKFTWNDRDDENIHIGTTAQYWQNILPETVKEFRGGLTLQYDVVALLSAISAAKEIVALKAEIADLKEKLKNL